MTPRGPIVSVLALAKGGEASPAKNIYTYPNMSQNGPYGPCGAYASGPGYTGTKWPELDLWLQDSYLSIMRAGMPPHGPFLSVLCVAKGGQASPAHQSPIPSDPPSECRGSTLPRVRKAENHICWVSFSRIG